MLFEVYIIIHIIGKYVLLAHVSCCLHNWAVFEELVARQLTKVQRWKLMLGKRSMIPVPLPIKLYAEMEIMP